MGRKGLQCHKLISVNDLKILVPIAHATHTHTYAHMSLYLTHAQALPQFVFLSWLTAAAAASVAATVGSISLKRF